MKRERSLPVRLVMLAVLLAATLPFFGSDCGDGVPSNQAGIAFYITNRGKDPMHFSHGSRKTRLAIGKGEVVAEMKVDAPKGKPSDGEAVLKMNRMDIDLGTLRISVPGNMLVAGDVTEIYITMNEPEYFKFEFTCENPTVGLDYQRP